jgi:hypothetical protein
MGSKKSFNWRSDLDDLAGAGYKTFPGYPKLAATTVSVEPGTIDAHTSAEIAVTVTGVKLGAFQHGRRHHVIQRPPALEAGLIPLAPRVTNNNEVTLTIANPTGAPIVGAAKDWVVYLARKGST